VENTFTFEFRPKYDKIMVALDKTIERLTRASTKYDEFKSDRLEKLNKDAEDSVPEEDDDEYELKTNECEYTQSMNSIV